MTNPGNIVRVRARNGGRASVYEANGWAQAYTSGLVEGTGVIQNTSADMNVLVGGSATKPDVILAENPAGYKVALDLIGQQAITVTAPASNSRISAIVAYTDDLSLATTEDTVTGSPASCGLIVVNGTAAANPNPPTDSQIRTAITSDGATGSQAAYCIIANITVESGTTAITNNEIAINEAQVGVSKLKRWIPDYANMDDTKHGTGWTATQDGFVYAFLTRWKSSRFFIDIKINGKPVATGYGEAQSSTGALIANTSGTFPVAAGDTVTFNYNSSTVITDGEGIYFIPGRWI